MSQRYTARQASRDTLASPLFYSVAVVALILGIASIFGFLQNPLKLKAVANAVHDKVSTSSPVRSSPRNNYYSLNQSFKNKDSDTDINRISYQQKDKNRIEKIQQPHKVDDLNRVSFNYVLRQMISGLVILLVSIHHRR